MNHAIHQNAWKESESMIHSGIFHHSRTKRTINPARHTQSTPDTIFQSILKQQYCNSVIWARSDRRLYSRFLTPPFKELKKFLRPTLNNRLQAWYGLTISPRLIII